MSASKILKKIYGKVGSVYRIGGDEFVVIADIEKKDSGEYIKKLRDAIAEWKGIHIDSMSASVGVARMDEIGENTSLYELVKTADARMYDDKAAYYKQHDRRN